jgi:hypothetical protein
VVSKEKSGTCVMWAGCVAPAFVGAAAAWLCGLLPDCVGCCLLLHMQPEPFVLH